VHFKVSHIALATHSILAWALSWACHHAHWCATWLSSFPHIVYAQDKLNDGFFTNFQTNLIYNLKWTILIYRLKLNQIYIIHF
jgi:hypothetical protein